ncbi:hypothetical protein ABIC75_004595 [Dyella japonica]|uniref:Transposase n=1 Tax=Dyella japonica TaxID=231455 RepID=A0ABV2K190_9GAMM
MRRFAGIEFNEDAISDESTIQHFRRCLEDHDLASKMLDIVNQHLTRHGVLLREGAIIDATIMNAPNLIKNRDKTRDPEKRHRRKGEQCFFSMKAHFDIDVESGLMHTATTTPVERPFPLPCQGHPSMLGMSAPTGSGPSHMQSHGGTDGLFGACFLSCRTGRRSGRLPSAQAKSSTTRGHSLASFGRPR